MNGILELQRLATGEPDRDPGREPDPPCGKEKKIKLLRKPHQMERSASKRMKKGKGIICAASDHLSAMIHLKRLLSSGKHSEVLSRIIRLRWQNV